MKIWHAIHESELTDTEQDLLLGQNTADFYLSISAGLHQNNLQFATCMTKLAVAITVSEVSGNWHIFELCVRVADVVHWITDDGTPRNVRYRYEGRVQA